MSKEPVTIPEEERDLVKEIAEEKQRMMESLDAHRISSNAVVDVAEQVARCARKLSPPGGMQAVRPPTLPAKKEPGELTAKFAAYRR